MKETKEERFVRVAERRTNAVLEKLRVLGNCSNRGMYEYSPSDVKKIFGVLKKTLRETEQLFEDKSSTKFKLK